MLHYSLPDKDNFKGTRSCGPSRLSSSFDFTFSIRYKSLDQEDIIDETLNYFRANVFFRNFDVRGGADRTLIYLTLYTQQCLVKCEKIEDKVLGIIEYFLKIYVLKKIQLDVSYINWLSKLLCVQETTDGL